MLVIKFELWPYGYEEHATEIGRATITNTGRGSHKSGDYRAVVTEKRRVKPGTNPPFYPEEKRIEVVEGTHIEGFPRCEEGCWELLRQALNKITEERKEHEKIQVGFKEA